MTVSIGSNINTGPKQKNKMYLTVLTARDHKMLNGRIAARSISIIVLLLLLSPSMQAQTAPTCQDIIRSPSTSDEVKDLVTRPGRDPDLQFNITLEYILTEGGSTDENRSRLLIRNGSITGGELGEERPFLTHVFRVSGEIERIEVSMVSPMFFYLEPAPYIVPGIIGKTEPSPHPDFEEQLAPTSDPGWEIHKLEGRMEDGELQSLYSLRLYPVSFNSNGWATAYDSVSIDCWVREIKNEKSELSIFNSTKPTGPVKYLIITDRSLAPYLEKLAIWKSQKGVFTKIVTTSEIDEQYSMKDIQTEMRAYVQEMESLHDLDYLLLVGDVDLVKTRHTKNLYPETMYGEPSTFATDGYFSCVSPGSSWNPDGDAAFVEVGELDDAIPDLAVGRIASNDGSVISGLVDSLISREKDFEWDTKMEKAIFIAGDPQNVEGYPPDTLQYFWEIYASEVFSGRETIYYDGTGSLPFSANSFRETVGDTHQAICYFSHGTQTGLPGLFSNTQVSSMHSTGPEGMIFTMACLTGYFDSTSTECFAEVITENSDRGALGYVGSSRLAVGGIDTVYEGDAPGLEEDYWRAIKKAHDGELDPTVGDVYREALTHFSTSFYPFPTSYYYYSAQRTFLEYNLFGEPEAPLFLHEPKRLNLEFQVSEDNRTVRARVTNDTGIPVKDSRVTLFRYKELGVSGITDQTGEVIIEIPLSNGGIVNITASKPGELPTNSSFTLPDEFAPTAIYRITPLKPDGFNDLYTSLPLIELMGDEPVEVNFTFQGRNWGWSGSNVSFHGEEGSNLITFRVRDRVGLVSRPVDFNFTVDRTPPNIYINTTPNDPDGLDGWFNTIPLISMNSSEDIVAAYYKLDDDAESQYTGPFTLINGIHTVIFRAFDVAGNMNTTGTTFKVDLMKPYSTLTVSHEPDGESGFYVTRPTIIIKAFDENGARIQYRWDEGNWSDLEGSIYPPVGTHLLEYRAVDHTGNFEEKTNFQWFRFDPDPPMIDISLYPSEPDGLNGYYVTKPTLSVMINSSETGNADVYLVLSQPGRGFSWANDSLKISGPLLIPEGNWVLNFMAKDEAGNQHFPVPLEVRVDLTPPDLIIDLTPGQPDGENRWYISAPKMSVLNLSGDSRALFRMDNANDWETIMDLIDLPPGQHTVEIKAVDNAGNEGGFEHFDYMYDDEDPIASLTAGKRTFFENDTVEVYASASSDDNGPLIYRFTISDGRNTLWMDGHVWNFTFNQTGNYTISVIVKDQSGRSNTSFPISIEVIKRPLPPANDSDLYLEVYDPYPSDTHSWTNARAEEIRFFRGSVILILLLLAAILLLLVFRKLNIKEVEWEGEDDWLEEDWVDIDLDAIPEGEKEVLIFE